MGELVGYARVSTIGQNLDVQLERLREAGVTKLFVEKRSGLDGDRAELGHCLEYLREGDTLIVTKLDRLARSTLHLHTIVEQLAKKNVGFRVLDDASLDTTSRTGKLVFGILASIAEFETQLRRERQMEGIARAKSEGRMGGRPRLVTDEKRSEIYRLRSEGLSIRKIAVAIGFSKASVQKALANQSAPADKMELTQAKRRVRLPKRHRVRLNG